MPERFTRLLPPRPLDEALLQAQSFIAALGADVRHGANIAAHVPALDCILLPHQARFESDARYLSNPLHEHGHWTGHKSRLARDLTGRFGDNAYAGEELVAELTAALLCAELAIPGQLRHPEYIDSWLKVLGGYQRAIFTAAGRATEGANYSALLHGPINAWTPKRSTNDH